MQDRAGKYLLPLELGRGIDGLRGTLVTTGSRDHRLIDPDAGVVFDPDSGGVLPKYRASKFPVFGRPIILGRLELVPSSARNPSHHVGHRIPTRLSAIPWNPCGLVQHPSDR